MPKLKASRRELNYQPAFMRIAWFFQFSPINSITLDPEINRNDLDENLPTYLFRITITLHVRKMIRRSFVISRFMTNCYCRENRIFEIFRPSKHNQLFLKLSYQLSTLDVLMNKKDVSYHYCWTHWFFWNYLNSKDSLVRLFPAFVMNFYQNIIKSLRYWNRKKGDRSTERVDMRP